MFVFTIQVRDATGTTDTESFSITINPPRELVITNQSDTLSPGTVGEFYCCGNLFADGGVAPYTWSLVGGELPPGLDWRQWLGPAKARPFDPKYVVNWRSYFDFGGGTLTDLFTHWIDVAHLFVGEDLPRAATAMGGIFQYADGRDAPDTVDALLAAPTDPTHRR